MENLLVENRLCEEKMILMLPACMGVKRLMMTKLIMPGGVLD